MTVPNGVITLSADLAPNSVAILQCNSGYRPRSQVNRSCMFGGQWSEGNLKCEEDSSNGANLLGIMCILVHVLYFSMYK